MANQETDTFITENFRGDLDKLSAGDYDDWKKDRDGKLAAILLTDQFTRNMFRKRKEAFAYDYIALGIAKSISIEEYLTYKMQEQVFLMLPFEHSENAED